MTAIIIGIGLDNKFISSDVAYLPYKENVGKQEISRLLGKGKAIGQGPLPTFIQQAVMAGRGDGEVGLVVITRAASVEAATAIRRGKQIYLDDVEVADSLKPWLGEATLVVLGEDEALWGELQGAIRRVIDFDPALIHEQDDLRFVIVGCHTENRVIAIASFLRNVLGAKQVAVSAHLSGSSSIEAHYAALRHNLPGCGIGVLLDLEETARYAGLPVEPFSALACHPCAIGPEEACGQIAEEQRSIIEYLCMHWSRAQLRPLQGGFSGSLLFLADGWKGQARTEPVVLKIDRFEQMRREIGGYHQVKDFFGKHVPTFSHPVALGDFVGVAMEFAAMEGRPETLQDSFVAAEDDEGYQQFLQRFRKSLTLLSEKLYSNTQRTAWVTPYRLFGLHAEQQMEYLRGNLGIIQSYCDELTLPSDAVVSGDIVQSMFKLIVGNEDGIESEMCLVHGDLNLQNVICDHADNIWFIDWTHTGEYPLEMDFAKLENDVKFVMSTQFDIGDLSRLKQFEEYLLGQRIPSAPNDLPRHLKYVKWDLRYRKILEAVRLIREVCFSIKQSDDWLVYQVALLRFATHTLSFDQRRDRGECALPQLMHALYSVEALTFNLVGDDFHLRIRGERPADYPTRQCISIDYSPWAVDCEEYAPPYYVHESVLANDTANVPGGWADPEVFSTIDPPPHAESSRHRDDEGRPLNPRGRTGLGGRGLLGRWGVNPAAAALVLRMNESGDHVDVLVGTKADGAKLWLVKGFVQYREEVGSALTRILESETGWQPESTDGVPIAEGYFYDSRQTDHAWVEMQAVMYFMDFEVAPRQFRPGGDFEDVTWMPVNAETINRMPSPEARFVRAAVKHLQEHNTIDDKTASRVLARTG